MLLKKQFSPIIQHDKARDQRNTDIHKKYKLLYATFMDWPPLPAYFTSKQILLFGFARRFMVIVIYLCIYWLVIY